MIYLIINNMLNYSIIQTLIVIIINNILIIINFILIINLLLFKFFENRTWPSFGKRPPYLRLVQYIKIKI